MTSSNRHRGSRVVVLAFVGFAALAIAPWANAQRPVIPMAETPNAAELPAPAGEEQPAALDEVIVRGGRLYDRIVRAEDRLFQLFNELNEEDDFDIHCAAVSMDQGSRIEQRFCMPEFFADAKAEQVRLSQYCQSLVQKDDDGNVTSQGPCYEPPTAEQLFFARREEYVRNMVKVIDSNSVLQKMYTEVELLHRERASLENRFQQIKDQQISDAAEKNRYKPAIRR